MWQNIANKSDSVVNNNWSVKDLKKTWIPKKEN